MSHKPYQTLPGLRVAIQKLIGTLLVGFSGPICPFDEDPVEATREVELVNAIITLLEEYSKQLLKSED